MKAAVLDAPGTADAFAIRDVPVPVVGDDDLLVEVAACGVSFRDVVERNGTYRRDVRYPLIMGLEISGVVRAHGRAVTAFEIGERVCSKAFSSCGRCRLCRSGRETTCSLRQPVRGGYGQFTALPQDAWVRTPAHMPFTTSCSLGPACGVALNAVRDVAQVKLGETVLVTGATGGVGLPSVQISRLAGARVIAVTRGPSKAQALYEAGAHHVVVPDAQGAFSRQVRQLTGGDGVDVVVDNVGSAVFHEAFDSLAVHGRYALVGQLTGEETRINLARIFFKRAQILGVGSVSSRQLADAIALADAGSLVPRIAAVLPLEEIAAAHRMVEEAAAVGRIVISPNPHLLEERQ